MEQAQALAVIRSLANGVDPVTGEVFPAESAYQRPLVVRALYEAASALERQERVSRRKSQLPAKTGEPWTEDEDRKLLSAFDQGKCLQDLAAHHERTMGAVRARLVKYGRLNPS
jgi:DNA-binding transcriptional regulator YbjK